MKTFIKASKVKLKKEKINKGNITAFIDGFNAYIEKGDKAGEGVFRLNNGLNDIPTLNNTEFDYVMRMAEAQGWELTQSPDNYNSTTYKMKKI